MKENDKTNENNNDKKNNKQHQFCISPVRGFQNGSSMRCQLPMTGQQLQQQQQQQQQQRQQ
jgi:hypothetical protein